MWKLAKSCEYLLLLGVVYRNRGAHRFFLRTVITEFQPKPTHTLLVGTFCFRGFATALYLCCTWLPYRIGSCPNEPASLYPLRPSARSACLQNFQEAGSSFSQNKKYQSGHFLAFFFFWVRFVQVRAECCRHEMALPQECWDLPQCARHRWNITATFQDLLSDASSCRYCIPTEEER